MKTYKHKTLGYIAIKPKELKDRYKIKGMAEFLLADLVENSCDWEEVAQEYEIIEYVDKKGNGYGNGNPIFTTIGDGKIHILSIKRLSDNTVFSLIDTVRRTPSKEAMIIEKIIIDDKDDVRFIQGKEGDEDYCDVLMKYVEKVKEPLHTTEDGVNLFGGESVYGVTSTLDLTYCSSFREHDSKHLKVFAEKDKAKRFVKENKKQFSLNDIKEAEKNLNCFKETLITYLEKQI